jgi:4'-phosphopantetheinyl transferase
MKLIKHPLLKPNEVHIWSACLSKNESKATYFSALLSGDERERASCFKFSRDQKRYTISRGILRSLLAAYLGETPQKIEIAYGLWGKPCLPKEKVLSFNLSHSGDYVLYALTQGYEVGIDLEYIDETLGLEDMARSIFSIEEFSYWCALPSEEKVHTFFKYWVLKEAFLKASGKGWLESKYTLALTGINDLKQEQKSGLLKDDKIAYSYSFESIPGYASALFVEGPCLTPLHYHCDKDFPY